MTTVRAAVFTEVSHPFAFRELDLQEPRADEVQVRVVAAGVCHTDAVVRDGWIPTPAPAVLGHEGAGIVEKTGSAVHHLAPGDHVVLSFASCGVCPQCLAGHPAYCVGVFAENFAARRRDGSTAFTDADGTAVGSHFFGQSSFAELTDVAVRSVVKVPDDAPLDLLGPLGCGIQTGSGAVLTVLAPAAGASIVVFGAGAVGMSAIMAAAVAHAGRIIAVDVVDSRLAAAGRFGATDTVNAAAEDVVARIRGITGSGADCALDTTGDSTVFRQMIESLAVAGHAGVIGASRPGSQAVIDMGDALARGIRVTWILEGDAVPQTFIPRLLTLWRAGVFPFDELITKYDVADIDTAFDDSARGVTLKPVVVF